MHQRRLVDIQLANIAKTLSPMMFSTGITAADTRGGTSYGKLAGQNIFAAASTIPVCPHLLGAHALFPLQLRP